MAKTTKTRKKTSKKEELAKEQEVVTVILDANEDIQREEAKQEETKPASLGSFRDTSGNSLPKAEASEELQKEGVDAESEAMRPKGVYIEEESAAEMGDRLQKKADDYKEELAKISSIDELKKIEENLISELEMFDKYLKKVAYVLPQDVEFDGRRHPIGKVSSTIVKFIQRKEVQFSYTLGMYQLSKFWAASPRKIDYYTLNSTLETLNTLQFKGMSDWTDILMINEYFKACNKDYVKDLTAYHYFSTMHSHVIERMQICDPNAVNMPQGL